MTLADHITHAGVMEGLGPFGLGYDIQQSPDELADFLEAMRELNVYTVLELGTGARGGLARFLAEYMGWKVTSVDIARPEPVAAGEFVHASTYDAIKGLKQRDFDLVIIDADHTYDAVARDHKLYAPLGKIIMFHDICPGREAEAGAAEYWRKIAYTDGKLKAGYTEHTQGGIGIGWYPRAAMPERKPVRVSAIVSVYNAKRFLRGCLDDLLAQDIADELEIVCINSGSKHPEDAAVLHEYSLRHENIKVINTLRETQYAAWNIGIRGARGEYITNANTDDRHAPWALRKLAQALDKGADVAYGSYYCVSTPNPKWDEPWEQYFDDPVNYPGGIVPWGNHPFSAQRLWNFCFLGPQPMWRKSLHDQVGLFDTTFTIASDYEMWMRFAKAGAKFANVPLYLGLFYFDKEYNISSSDTEHLVTENRRIRLKFKELARHE